MESPLHRRRWRCPLAGTFLLVLLPAFSPAQPISTPELTRLRHEAAQVTIRRDDWGIAHVSGQTDADAVFGMIYAQAEDDFPRIERNYLVSLGRLSEAEGEKAMWEDLRQQLFIDPTELQRLYTQSPAWLQKLMNAWADGLNYYLATHPDVHPAVIHHFEPWMALSFTEGSIGGDIERVNLKALSAFYTQAHEAVSASTQPPHPPTPRELAMLADPDRFDPDKLETEPQGSNGIVIAASHTVDHHPLLLINPHTSFFFRSELQMTSGEGLNAYGAVTWGQFFIYQGFNDRAGWMHTSSGVDAVDEYVETVAARNGHWFYKYGNEWRPVTERTFTLRYPKPSGITTRTFTAYFTSHGPVIRAEGDHWITIQLMNIPIAALEQSYLRTKARTYAEYWKTMELQANSSNNTLFVDADGDIAYFHGNFIPRRDPRFDYTRPVDGSDPSTDWHGLLSVEETPHLLNPKSGYLFNVNNWPWTGAGASSLRASDYPAYVEMGGETARGQHAIRLLTHHPDFTLDSLLTLAFDSYLPWFDKPIPALVKAWDALPDADPRKAQLAEQVNTLRNWDHRWGVDSIATSLAIFWGTELRSTLSPKIKPDARTAGLAVQEYAATQATPDELLSTLAAASAKLTASFGTWKTPWGQINRFQRLTGDIQQPFNDAAPSIPVGFTSSVWGSLAAFGAHAYPGTKKWYGTVGNSFVAVVEFGPRIRARAITAGGESGHPSSPHFDDEAQRYVSGNLREVYFYPDQLQGHTERVYHPGE
ncbi:penicillin acylase family protein [Silvibacterium dinghuense]|uniref:Acylase n=1 Tax=Silvibacterium dinghuense TaxID=1560006 RepID=A0A4Q1SBA2_9BACT|nr:acylase [Silvibacterium dinghuense]